MKLLKFIFVILFFALICSEQILYFTPSINSKPLMGAYSIPQKPKLTLLNWLNNGFQDSLISYFEYNLKLHNFYVRTNNQINFSLFSQSAAKTVVLGKNNQLFDDYYIDGYLGKNYLGADTIKNRVARLALLQQQLAERNVTLVTLIAPGKPSIYPEDIPNNYPGLHNKSTSNYDTYIKEFQKQHIHLIDYRNYFISIKNKIPYETISSLGVHWNGYGSAIAADSLIKYLEKIRNIDMVDCIMEKGITTQEARYYDHDLMNLLNLVYKLPSKPLYYPKISFKSTPDKYKPSIILIGDSYTWAWIHSYPFFQNIFSSNSEFWYYNKIVEFMNNGAYPKNKSIESFNLAEKVKQRDFIILLFNERNLFEFDFKVTERMLKALKMQPVN